MQNDLLIEKVAGTLKKSFENFEAIKSAYLYGSVLTDKFNTESDIDVLFIVDDGIDRIKFLKEIKSARSKETHFKLDINVVFYSEFINLWHIFRPPTFFVWIKQRNFLLWGKDYLCSIKEEKITVNSIYKRAIDLAQGCRAVYLNDKDINFWEVRYSRWLRELQYGILYLHGELELDSRLCGKKLCRAYPELKGARLLSKKQLPIKDLSRIAEEFILCITKHFLKP